MPQKSLRFSCFNSFLPQKAVYSARIPEKHIYIAKAEESWEISKTWEKFFLNDLENILLLFLR